MHDDGTDKDREPSEAIFEHMEIDGLLIEGVAVTSDEGGEEVKNDTEDGEDNHAAGIDFSGLEDALDGFVNEEGGADKKHSSGDTGANEGVAFAGAGGGGGGLGCGRG